MSTRHFRTLLDLEADELMTVLDRAAELKRLRGTSEHPEPLRGKTIVVLLEKASTRTRLSFEVGITELGAFATTLIAKDTQMGRGEPLGDTARMLTRYAHGVVYRTFGHDRIEALAADAGIPVINGLSELYHPCQLLADMQTIRERTGGRLEGVRVTWVGDGNNMANSWILAAERTGLQLTIACPEGYDPHGPALEAAAIAGHEVRVLRDPVEACIGADVVTTDVFASMGQEEEAAKRARAFAGFMIDDEKMAQADPGAVFLHCLPAHRGEEVASAVIDGPQSRVWDQAENRLHAQKALLEFLVG
ncbi:MAG: ornithine carbamoyltransferase [Deltaproteobacteria bacterium]|nr:ornithine carbamoyltransferase [Deltaproteobacteria bacterium]